MTSIEHGPQLRHTRTLILSLGMSHVNLREQLCFSALPFSSFIKWTLTVPRSLGCCEGQT